MAASGELDDIAISLAKERKRLEKLWDAYEIQEKEYQEAITKINVLTEQLKEKDRLLETMKVLMADKDREIGELKLKITQLEQAKEEMGPKYQALEAELKEWKDKYKKLFLLATELESDISSAKRHIEIRDQWFKTHMGPILNIQPALKERERMIMEADRILKVKRTVVGGTENTEAPAETTTTYTATQEEEVDEGGLTKDDLIDVFMMIPSVTRTMAESLYEAGFRDIDDIKEADIQKLASLNGFNPTLARLVKKDVEMM